MGMIPPLPPGHSGPFLRAEMDLSVIEERINEYERTALLDYLKKDQEDRDPNVEESLQEVLMILKLLYGEEVGKKVFKFREQLLELREHALDEMKRAKRIKIKTASGKWTTGIKWLDKLVVNDRLGGGGTGPF